MTPTTSVPRTPARTGAGIEIDSPGERPPLRPPPITAAPSALASMPGHVADEREAVAATSGSSGAVATGSNMAHRGRPIPTSITIGATVTSTSSPM